MFIGFFLDGLHLVLNLYFFCISQIFISKLFQNNHENISNSNKKKKSYTFWSLILSGCSLCIISCYDINGKHVYFYNEYRRIHEVLFLATRTLSSWTNNLRNTREDRFLIVGSYSWVHHISFVANKQRQRGNTFA